MNAHWINAGIYRNAFNWVDQIDYTKERTIGDPNYVHIWWLEKAVESSRKVARLKFRNASASGFLVGKNIIMTNNHVIGNKRDAKKVVLQFNYKMQFDESVAPVDVWKCDPSKLFYTDEQLDFTIVYVKPKNGVSVGDKYGFFNLEHATNLYSENYVNLRMRVNIIQHPKGRYQQIVFRDNELKNISNLYLQYLTDTEPGSSGSPVLDDWFNPIAIHSQGVRDPNNPTKWYRNQGFRMDKIYELIANQLDFE